MELVHGSRISGCRFSGHDAAGKGASDSFSCGDAVELVILVVAREVVQRVVVVKFSCSCKGSSTVSGLAHSCSCREIV